MKNNILHRDLKLENMLIHFPNVNLLEYTTDKKREFLKNVDLKKEKFIVKIADLGLAKKVHYEGGFAGTSVGSPLYMAPEVIMGNKYNYKADIWSIGTVLFEMVTGFPPFIGRNIDDFTENVKDATYKIPKDIELSLDCFEFINGCLRFKSDERFTAD